MTNSPYKDGLAIIDNIIDGKALPEHLARSRAGTILPRSERITAKADKAATDRVYRDAVAKEAAARMNKAPLTAICFKHKCRCGQEWATFGFYARKVTQRVLGAADATFTKRLEYDPRPEAVAETEWRTVEETHCLACYGGPLDPAVSAH
jgi:hypothetical protein